MDVSATSTSISTDPQRGSAATPIAERECRPAAPNTSWSNCDAPSTTAGCASKPGALATKPSTVRTRSMRSSEPSSARSTDSAFERAPARRAGTVRHREVGTEHALHDRARVIARQLPGGARPATVHHHGVERVVRRVRTGQHDAEIRETLLDTGHAGNVSPMGWTVAPVPQARVYHYSEDPAIDRFEPHVPATNPRSDACVWAIEARCAPLYWFPRDWPRVAVWANDDEQAMRLRQQFDTRARRLHVIERARRPLLRTAVVYEYELDGARFAPWPDAEGQWAAHATVEPLAVHVVADLEARHRDAGVELPRH